MVPKGWSHTTFEKHIDCLTGFAFSSTEYSAEEHDIRLLRGDNIEPGKLRWINAKRWPRNVQGNMDKYFLLEGDFVIALDRTWISGGLKVAEVTCDDLPCLLVQRVARIRAKKTLAQGLLRQYFSGYKFEQYVKLTQTATAVPHISPNDIKQFSLLLPPIAEQKKIAQILSTWDKAIAVTEKLLTNSQQQKKALMQQLLTGKKRLLDENGERFSGEWKFKRISEIATRVQRKNDTSEHPILTISSLSGFVRQDERYSRYMAGESIKNYILLKKGEFAYNKGNSKTYEFGCVFDLDKYEAGLVPHVYVCFKLKQGLSHRYFKYLFEADYLKPQLGALVNTGVRNNGLLNIKPTEFMETRVPVPCFEEQERIADMLYNSSRIIRVLQGKLACLKEEKKALMQQLLTGKRRVKVEMEETVNA
ncbi:MULTISPECIES: restriction endonuclease subunit S [Enterobacteriaceae]|nr:MULTISPECIES: restriction endonuclease subunit S [Enterobacteriaceae]MBZ7520647.1 restriction endonuclease subunit S [Klebsiella variicola]MCC2017908.1 restriction endonuclease subunit S [Enterobacter hormaechei]MCW4871994.1 restriction endonuclease subunit S [Enterobacter hormaechei subsp. hoffmannii]MDA4592304.1 restriction endonuclease subunit S [Enterobacter hormaechei]MDV5641753.1 restriction endonuclease subunit S [Enterobacter hormaechei]